jgi:hypothetical protein
MLRVGAHTHFLKDEAAENVVVRLPRGDWEQPDDSLQGRDRCGS